MTGCMVTLNFANWNKVQSFEDIETIDSYHLKEL
jgi:hypothetical protein